MQFLFSSEQDRFRDSIRRFLVDKSPPSEVRRLMTIPNGFDPSVWRETCVDQGLIEICVPESFGGLGLGYVETSIAMEEMGRVLFCAPFLSSGIMATAAILHAGTDAQKKALLPALMSGDLIISLAISEAAGRWYSDTFETHATLEGGQWRINGHKKFILDGQIADKLIVAARTSDSANPELFIVDMDTPGVQSRTLETIDETRKQTEVFIKDAYAEPLGEVGKTDAPVSHVMDVALVCLANEMVGGAQHLLESAIEYAGTRVQFGRPIGSFQAIKHKCADMLMTVELAKSVAYGAAQILDAGDSNSSSAAAMAKACASDAYMTVARECIQIHGGIGFTWDHDTHLWFKRAKSSEVLFGDPSFHRDRYIELVSNAP